MEKERDIWLRKIIQKMRKRVFLMDAEIVHSLLSKRREIFKIMQYAYLSLNKALNLWSYNIKLFTVKYTLRHEIEMSNYQFCFKLIVPRRLVFYWEANGRGCLDT